MQLNQILLRELILIAFTQNILNDEQQRGKYPELGYFYASHPDYWVCVLCEFGLSVDSAELGPKFVSAIRN